MGRVGKDLQIRYQFLMASGAYSGAVGKDTRVLWRREIQKLREDAEKNGTVLDSDDTIWSIVWEFFNHFPATSAVEAQRFFSLDTEEIRRIRRAWLNSRNSQRKEDDRNLNNSSSP